MHVYNLQTETSNIFLFVSEELEKNIYLRDRKTRKRSKDLYKVNKNEKIQDRSIHQFVTTLNIICALLLNYRSTHQFVTTLNIICALLLNYRSIHQFVTNWCILL
jgi:hypothetical protein